MDTNAIRIEDDVIGGRHKHFIYWHTLPTYEANYLESLNPVIQPKIGKILKCHLNSCWSGMYSMQLVIALQVHRFQWRVCILHPPNTRTGLVRPVDIQANQFHNEAWAGYRVKMKSNQSSGILLCAIHVFHWLNCLDRAIWKRSGRHRLDCWKAEPVLRTCRLPTGQQLTLRPTSRYFHIRAT